MDCEDVAVLTEPNILPAAAGVAVAVEAAVWPNIEL